MYHVRTLCQYSLFASLLALTACTTPPDLPPPGDAAQKLVYRCDTTDILVAVEGEKAALIFPNEQINLAQTISASGARYEGGGSEFWSKGDEARITVKGGEAQQCELARKELPWAMARVRGVEFRGSGNEPGWFIEITPGEHIAYTGQYGEVQLQWLTPSPELRTEERLIYNIDDGTNSLHLIIEKQYCQDTMVDLDYSHTVNLIVNGDRVSGCGKFL